MSIYILSEEEAKELFPGLAETQIDFSDCEEISNTDSHPWKGKKHTPESLQRMKDNHKGMTGKKHSDISKKKISEATSGANNGFYGKKHTDETRKRMSNYVRTDEHKRKISESCKGRSTWNKGKTMSEETRKRMSESAKRRHATGKRR